MSHPVSSRDAPPPALSLDTRAVVRVGRVVVVVGVGVWVGVRGWAVGVGFVVVGVVRVGVRVGLGLPPLHLGGGRLEPPLLRLSHTHSISLCHSVRPRRRRLRRASLAGLCCLARPRASWGRVTRHRGSTPSHRVTLGRVRG